MTLEEVKFLLRALRQEVDVELEGHLDYLAKKQVVELETLSDLSSESTAEEQLEFIRTLASNIHKVQNGQSAAMIPRISKDLNGLDCSMSTWVMGHEAKKAGLAFELNTFRS